MLLVNVKQNFLLQINVKQISLLNRKSLHLDPVYSGGQMHALLLHVALL